MTDPVTYAVRDGVAVIEIYNPPFNALDRAVRTGILEALMRLSEDKVASAAIICAKGPSFLTPSDVRDFEDRSHSPLLTEVCDALEASKKPIVACLHGAALGGGYELALAAHARLAKPGAKVGFPEITLGLIPEAGGTQRLPRLVPVDAALEMLLSGKSVDIAPEHNPGWVDGVVDGDLISAGISYATGLVDAGFQPTRERRERFGEGLDYQDAIARARTEYGRSPTQAPTALIDCIEAAPLLPFDAGAALERDLFTSLANTDEAQALRHVYIAVREAATPRGGLPEVAAPWSVGLVGGGAMGAGIAVSCLDSGRPVQLVERDEASVAAAEARIRGIYQRAVSRRRLGQDAMTDRLARLTCTTDLDALSDADIVIEAVPEDLATKEAVWARIGRVAKEGALLATNTSYLDIEYLAEASERPNQMLALHFFAPAHVQHLVEVGVCLDTGQEAEAAAFAFVNALQKKPVRVSASEGLIGNRILTAFRLAADGLVARGASPYDVDAAMRAYGFKMGPYEAFDLSGLDVSAAFRALYAEGLGARRFDVADMLMREGALGQKTGRGFYKYLGDDRRTVRQNPALLATIASEREARGMSTTQVSAAEIEKACLLAMANEGARILDEGLAERAGDIDVVMLLAFGFPRHKGGPMKAAELRGLLGDLRTLEIWAAADPFWAPAEGLRDAVKNGNRFSAVL
ncbi:MAG: 3-hydroxyacyl-CoA dehydrogenase NAD-binding domain-containing protein [Pseudomonadota bacterium]